MTPEDYFNYNHKQITLHFYYLWRVQRKSESHYEEGIASHYISVTEEETLRHVCLPIEATCSWTMTADPNRGRILKRYYLLWKKGKTVFQTADNWIFLHGQIHHLILASTWRNTSRVTTRADADCIISYLHLYLHDCLCTVFTAYVDIGLCRPHVSHLLYVSLCENSQWHHAGCVRIGAMSEQTQAWRLTWSDRVCMRVYLVFV